MAFFNWSKKKDPNYGPMFNDEYPMGFQPQNRKESLMTAFNVTSMIQTKLFKLLRRESETNNTKDFDQFKQICQKINEIIQSVKQFKDSAETNSLTSQIFHEDFHNVIEVIDGGVRDIANLNITGKNSCVAAMALADILQIVRKSIPNIFSEEKNKIAAKRDGLVDKITVYKDNMAVELQAEVDETLQQTRRME